MYFIVSKVLQELLWPLTWILVALGAALWWLRRGKSREATWAIVGALGVALIASSPLIAGALFRSLERYYPNLPASEYPTAPAMVVLGGTMSYRFPPRFDPEEGFGSRVVPAARLFRLGRAKVVLVTSGGWYRDGKGERHTEAEDMADLLVELGVPRAAIIVEPEGRSTRENARYSAKLLKERQIDEILLVTSAYHMRRAAALFREQGLKVTPVSTAHEIGDGSWSIGTFVPSVGAMERTTSAIKEYVGYWFR